MTPFDQAVQALRELAQLWTSPISPQEIPVGRAAFQQPQVRAFFAAADALDAASTEPFMAEVARTIETLPMYQASRLALMAGTQIENGADPAPTMDAILEGCATAAKRSLGYCERASQRGVELSAESLDPSIDPDGYRALMAVRFFAMAAMAALARQSSLRTHARSNRAVATAVAEIDGQFYLGEVSALAELLAASDDDVVIVLCPATKLGARLRTVAVRNTAHLYTLIDLVLRKQDIDLLGDTGTSPAALSAADQRMLAAARGDSIAYREVYDDTVRGRLLFAPFTAEVRPDGTFTAFPLPGVDANLTEFPRIDDAVVLLAADRSTTGPDRTWSANFFDPLHGALRSDVVVEATLDTTEVERLLLRSKQKR